MFEGGHHLRIAPNLYPPSWASFGVFFDEDFEEKGAMLWWHHAVYDCPSTTVVTLKDMGKTSTQLQWQSVNHVHNARSILKCYKNYGIDICVLEDKCQISTFAKLFLMSQDTLSLHLATYVNLSPPSATYTRQWTGSALVQIMACRLDSAKP